MTFGDRSHCHPESKQIFTRANHDASVQFDTYIFPSLGHRSLHWFRKDLRLHDNPSLRECLTDSKVFYGVYFLECAAEDKMTVIPNRWRFLLQSLQDLDRSLAQCGSRLFVLKGRPMELLPSLFKKWDITRLSFEVDCEPFRKSRDAVITGLAKQSGVEVISRVSHTLYDAEALLMSTDGRVPQVFDEFMELALQLGRPQMPAPRVNRQLFGSCVTPVGRDHDQQYGVPTLEEMGFQKPVATGPWFYPGGEQEALTRMEAALQKV